MQLTDSKSDLSEQTWLLEEIEQGPGNCSSSRVSLKETV